MKKVFAEEFIDFIDKSPSTYHAVKNCSDMLEKNGFIRLDPSKEWKLEKNGKYYIKKTSSTIMAFTVGEEISTECGFRIAGSHTDSPCFRIKPNPEMTVENIIRLNTEVYGGPILSTWFDRPLSIAGRVILKTDNIFRPETVYINIDRPLMTIPNLAIHQNRSVNQGVEIDRQNDVLPVIGLINEAFEKEDFLINLVSNESNIDKKDILDFDLYVYAYEKGTLLGAENEFVSAPKIDNLASVYTGLRAVIESRHVNKGINIFVGFDNEEVGSSTKQGADSNYLMNYMERIYIALGMNRGDFLTAVNNSFLISADGAHAAHPGFTGKMDPTNKPSLNQGVVFKISANQKYTSDGFSISVIKQIIEGKDIKTQDFVNNSKEAGGSTIGPISSTHLETDSVDLGIPMLAMHSVRELCGRDDLYSLKELIKVFFEV